MRNERGEVGIFLIVAACVGLIVVGIYFVGKEQAAFEARCADLGGHVAEDTDVHVGTGFTTSGKAVTTTTTSTDYFCLSDDGRILEMK